MSGSIGNDLDRAKTIVATFKNAGMNARLSDGFALLQKLSTLFGTTCDVVQRLIKVAHWIPVVFADTRLDSEKKIAAEYA